MNPIRGYTRLLGRLPLVLAFVVGAVMCMGMVASEAQAARSGGTRALRRSYIPRGGYGRGGYSRPRPAPLPQVSTAEAEAAYQRLIGAQAELTRSQRAFDQFFLSKPNTPGLAEALSEFQDAQVAHERADAVVAQSLRGNSEYLALLARKEEAQRRLEVLRDSGAGNFEQIVALAAEAMDWGGKASRMQADAEAADPNVTQTKAKLVAVAARVRELRAQAEQALRNDPNWLAARDARDQAKTNVNAAEAAFAAADQRLAAARYAYEQARLYNQRNGYYNNRAGWTGRW